MQEVEFQGSNDLIIQVHGFPRPYYPGDIISGLILRNVQTVSSRARITIALVGQCKVSHQVSHHDESLAVTSKYPGPTYSFWKSEDMLFTLHDGPLHIPPEGGTLCWPFSLALPAKLSPQAIGSRAEQKLSYLSLDPEFIAAQPLPSTFSLYEYALPAYDYGVKAYVEYFLKASLVGVGTKTAADAILPILVRTPSTPHPITNFMTVKQPHPNSITSQRVKSHYLLPGMEVGSELSFSQKAQKFSGSGKIPHLNLGVEVEVPKTIQLDHPSAFPLGLRIAPHWRLSTESIRNLEQKATLTALTLKIREDTDVLCGGISHGPTVLDRRHTMTYDLGLMSVLTEEELRNIPIPFGDDVQPLDIGTLLQLKISRQHASVLGRAISFHPFPGMQPDFTTYNIKHQCSLLWRVTIEIAGKTFNVKGSQTTRVLARSDEQGGQELNVAVWVNTKRKYDYAMKCVGADAIIDEDQAPPSYESIAG